jgi:hypothetical protein
MSYNSDEPPRNKRKSFFFSSEMQIAEEPVWLRQFMNYNGILTESIFYEDPAFPQPLSQTSLLKICFRYHVTILFLYAHSIKYRYTQKHVKAFVAIVIKVWSANISYYRSPQQINFHSISLILKK